MPTQLQNQLEIIPTARLGITTSASSQNIEGNTQGAMLGAYSLPLNAEIARLGNTYVGGTTTASAVAPVASLPTTAAHFILFNGESQTSGTGKSYVIHRVGFTSVASSAAAIQAHLIAHNSTAAVAAAPSNTAGLGPKSCSGRANQSSAVVGSTATIVNSGVWHPVGPSVLGLAATASIALGSDYDVNGLYVVPPGGIFSLATFCSAAGIQTCTHYVVWSEVLIGLG
jgi:hypothetical protein